MGYTPRSVPYTSIQYTTPLKGGALVASRKLPQDDAELKRLVDEMGSASAVARHFGVGRSSVSSRLKRYNQPTQAPGMSFAPWIVTRDHANSETGRLLRLLHQHEVGPVLKFGSGRSVDEIVTTAVTEWKHRLECNDYVISYHPDTPSHMLEKKGGFYYRPRTPGDSPGIMQPHPDDEPAPEPGELNEWGRHFSFA